LITSATVLDIIGPPSVLIFGIYATLGLAAQGYLEGILIPLTNNANSENMT
jgi:hypothetical protein